MRRVGWIFLAIAFSSVLLTTVFGRENLWLLSTLLIALFLGTALLVSSFAVRLYRGDVKLRLWDAAKMAAVIFSMVLTLRLLAHIVFQSEDFDLTEAIILSAVFALVYGLYTTAYRRRA